MFFPVFLLAILWVALPLALLPLGRRSGLPVVTATLTLTAGLVAGLSISLPPGFLPNAAPDLASGTGATDFASLFQRLNLIALTMWLFGAGGLVLFAGGLVKGAKAGLLSHLGAAGLFLVYLGVGLRLARAVLPDFATLSDAETAERLLGLVGTANLVSNIAVVSGLGLILLLTVTALLTRLRKN